MLAAIFPSLHKLIPDKIKMSLKKNHLMGPFDKNGSIFFSEHRTILKSLTASVFCKWFGPRFGPTKQSGSKFFETLIVLLKEFRESFKVQFLCDLFDQSRHVL